VDTKRGKLAEMRLRGIGLPWLAGRDSVPAMDKSTLRWGILGTANIARKNWQAIRHSNNGIVTAVASRDLDRSRRFINDCQAHTPFPIVPTALGSYDELIADPELDAVYIPLPTGLRKQWVKRAAQAGKHVVSEKPCAVTVSDLQEMLEVCRQHKVQFLDGVMFMHSRRLAQMREVLDNGKNVGRIRRISSAFSFNAPAEFFASNIRGQSDLEPHGCLGDLGWYCIRFSIWAMGYRLPKCVTGRMLNRHPSKEHGAAVPTEFSGELLFEGGVSASFYCSFVTELQQWAQVSGTTGSLSLPDFVLPSFGSELFFETSNPVFSQAGCDFNLEPHVRRWSVDEYSNSHPTAQETNLFRHFADQVRSGTLNSAWPEAALKTQQVLQACRDSALAQSKPIELAD
jgi:predicted dehydrogenase